MFVYVLECKNGKYYVGRSKKPAARITAHKAGRGSEWTRKYPVIRCIRQVLGDGFEEEKQTLMCMAEFGVNNVRGGSYCQLELSAADFAKARQTLTAAQDRCYKCGGAGHFAKKCAAASLHEIKPVPEDCATSLHEMKLVVKDSTEKLNEFVVISEAAVETDSPPNSNDRCVIQ